MGGGSVARGFIREFTFRLAAQWFALFLFDMIFSGQDAPVAFRPHFVALGRSMQLDFLVSAGAATLLSICTLS